MFEIPHLGVDDVGPCLLSKPVKETATNGLHSAAARAGFPGRDTLAVVGVGDVAACCIAVANDILGRI